jgi:hypothetical protein
MSVQNDHQLSQSHAEDAWADQGSDFVLITEGKPPPRIEMARERLLICRLYLGLLRTITDDYGAEFASHSDSLAYRTIGIYVFLRTVMCSPVRASQIAGSGLPARLSPLSGKCPGGKGFFANSAKDARPVIAEAALQYARMLIASALSKRGNADGECPASI